MDFCKYFGL